MRTNAALIEGRGKGAAKARPREQDRDVYLLRKTFEIAVIGVVRSMKIMPREKIWIPLPEK